MNVAYSLTPVLPDNVDAVSGCNATDASASDSSGLLNFEITSP